MYRTLLSSSLSRLLVLAVFMSLGMSSGCDDSSGGDFSTSSRPDIALDRNELSYGEVAQGAYADQVFQVRNLGDADLSMHKMTISGTDAASFTLFVSPDVPHSGQPIVVAALNEPGDSRELLVRYTPQHVGGASATLTISSNDPDEAEVKIALRSLENGPRPQVVPNPIVFGLVDGGEVAHRAVRVVNVGSAPLRFQKIWLTGSRDFGVEVGSYDDIPFPSEALEPGKGFDLRILYAPEVIGPDSGTLDIEYWFDDSTTRFYEADISANGAEPCIRITPQDAIDFGQALVGEAHPMTVTIENCGSEELTVTGIELAEGSDVAFALSDVPPEVATGVGFVLVQDDFRQFRVVFSPTAEVPSVGELVITSDAPARPEIRRDLRGIGTSNQCPTAVAGGRVKNTSDPQLDSFVATRLQAIELDGSGSSDPDGQPIASYQWSIAKAPPGFSQTFNNDTAVRAEIQLTQVGDYVFELIVFDEYNRPSCNTARVEVRANSNQEVVIELSWRTPSDFDETDTCVIGGCGTDLDLHMVPPGGTWNEAFGKDCYWGNKRPAWGAAGLDDDPFLDHDDVDGGGPETISIKAPARTDGSSSSGYNSPYEIGVYFYDDWGFAPPVFAQMRLFMDGTTTPTLVLPTNASNEMQMRISDPDLWQSGHFWLVGDLDWTANGGVFHENPATSPQTGFPW